MEAAAAGFRPLVLESVRCLECGEIYSKPSAGGTVEKNPGCPCCGYVGWIPVTVPAEVPRRFGAGLRPPRLVRAR
jgi:hypothetical protein